VVNFINFAMQHS